MKSTYLILIIYFLSFCPLLAIQSESYEFYSSQEKIDENSTYNFLSEDGELVWQAIYDTDISIEDIKKNLIQKGVLIIESETDNTITGTIKPFDVSYKKQGKSSMQIPLYVRDSSFTGFVLIEIKDNRYRVTIRDLKAVYSFTNGLVHKGDEFKLKDFAISSKGILKKSFLKSAAPLLNYDFTNMFTTINLNEDW